METEPTWTNRKNYVQEMIRNHLQKQEALVEATRKRLLNILIEEDENGNPEIRILQNIQGDQLHLTTAAYAVAPFKKETKEIQQAELTVEELETSNIPRLLIYEPRENDELKRFAQIGKYLPGFIAEQFPMIKLPPIWIFRSMDEFRLRLPFVRMRYFGNLVTANITSTADPFSSS